MKGDESSELEDLGELFKQNVDLGSACGSPCSPPSKLHNIFMQMGSKIKPVKFDERGGGKRAPELSLRG